MLYATPFGIGNREEYPRVVGFFDDTSGGSYRQPALWNLVYHFHRLPDTSVRYPPYSRRLLRYPPACTQSTLQADIRHCSSVRSEDNAGVDDERAPWAPRHSETEQRRMDCQLRYDLEMEFRKIGWGDPALVYDEEQDLFRFRDGRFAFSREHADCEALGYQQAYLMPEYYDEGLDGVTYLKLFAK